jgi:hypothetical protein
MIIDELVDVPHLSRTKIAIEVQLLLSDFAKKHGELELPIPIERILEFHLRLSLTICSLRELLGVDDALGALSVETCEVMVDEHLNPDVHTDLEGRYRFTIAHEIGHWHLHRHIYEQLRVGIDEAAVFRDGNKGHLIERQANYFGACLLMPKPFLYPVWREITGSRVATLSQLEPRREELLESEIVRRGIEPRTEAEETNMVLDAVALPLAQRFHVSPAAMRIRLEELKLLDRS